MKTMLFITQVISYLIGNGARQETPQQFVALRSHRTGRNIGGVLACPIIQRHGYKLGVLHSL
jgi:hypothetical protein